MGMARVIYRSKPKVHSWARWMTGRTMRKNSNNLVSFVGKVGSGKTWSAISCAEIMSKMSGVPFGVENIVFSLKELMTLINSGDLKRGSCIIFDEPQISISAKDFQSQANKIFNMLVSTFRHRNFSLFFCCPFEGLLDKSTRRLFIARMEMLSINPNKETCRVKPRYIEYSDHKAMPYTKQLIVSFKDGEGINRNEKLHYWDIPKPSQELIELYEAKKLAFTSLLNRNIMEKLDEFDGSGKSMTADNPQTDKRKPLTFKQERVLRTLAEIKAPNKYEIASQKLEISSAAISKQVLLSKKKGYSIDEFRGDENE